MPPDMRTPRGGGTGGALSRIVGEAIESTIVQQGRDTMLISTEIVVLKAVA